MSGIFWVFEYFFSYKLSYFTHMSFFSFRYIGYVDGTSGHKRHITSTAWVLYTLESELLSSRGIFLSEATNNISKYMSVIQLLIEVASHDISNLVVQLDSQLVIKHLNKFYRV